VFPAGPEQRALGQSVPGRTSTASSGSECSPPGLNHKESPKIYQIESEKECQKIYLIHMPERMSEDLPDRTPGGRGGEGSSDEI